MCDFILLSAYWDDELPEPEKSRLTDHLASCPQCQDWLRGVAALTRTIALFPHAPVPPDFADRVLTAVEAQTPERPASIGEAMRALPAYTPKADFLSRLMAKLPVCPSFEDLSAWVDGELDEATVQTVVEHLPECGVCRRRVEQLQLLSGAVRTLPVPAARPATLMTLGLGQCPSFADLSAWVDGELAELEAVAGHVATCADCARAVANMRTLGAAVRSLPVPAAQGASLPCPDPAEYVVDGELPADLAAHLETCKPCRTRLHRWEVLGRAMRQLPAPAVAADFAGRVVAQVPTHPAPERLHGYHDGELDDAERQAVQAHLDECGPCRTRVANFAKLSAAMAALPAKQVPAGFAFGVAARVPKTRSLPARRVLRWPAAMAAGFLVFGFVIYQQNLGGGPGQATMTADQGAVTLANVSYRAEDVLLGEPVSLNASAGLLDEWSQ